MTYGNNNCYAEVDVIPDTTISCSICGNVAIRRIIIRQQKTNDISMCLCSHCLEKLKTVTSSASNCNSNKTVWIW